MHRYIPGLLLVQIVTVALFWFNLGADKTHLLLQAGIPALFITVVTAFWFATIGRADAERSVTKLKLDHAKEREKLQVNAERGKARLLKQNQQEMKRQEKSVSRKANMKVGVAFAGAAAAGVVMLITELLTFGLLTITASVSGLGGYLVRSKQGGSDEKALSKSSEPKVIEHIPSTPQLSSPKKKRQSKKK